MQTKSLWISLASFGGVIFVASGEESKNFKAPEDRLAYADVVVSQKANQQRLYS